MVWEGGIYRLNFGADRLRARYFGGRGRPQARQQTSRVGHPKPRVRVAVVVAPTWEAPGGFMPRPGHTPSFRSELHFPGCYSIRLAERRKRPGDAISLRVV